MRALKMSLAVAVLIGSVGTGACKDRPLKNDFSGSVTINAQPAPNADVFLLSSAGKVIATAKTDVHGKYAIAVPAKFAGGWLVAKLYRPIVGARARAVQAPGEAVDFAVSDGDAVTLSGEVAPPPGVKPDWIDVHLTPRKLEGFPEIALDSLLAVDTGTAIHGTFTTQKINQLHFEFRALPGLYELRVDRIVDVPLDTPLATPNLTAQSVELPGHAAATERFGGFVVPLDKPLHVTVSLKLAQTH
jgi:hypothetical protein